jgi:hypothetical protein
MSRRSDPSLAEAVVWLAFCAAWSVFWLACQFARLMNRRLARRFAPPKAEPPTDGDYTHWVPTFPVTHSARTGS